MFRVSLRRCFISHLWCLRLCDSGLLFDSFGNWLFRTGYGDLCRKTFTRDQLDLDRCSELSNYSWISF
ncbi:hypothetical protein D3C76_1671470 [compost metagenome]